MPELTETEIDGDPRSRSDNPLARVAGHARINSESNRREMPRREATRRDKRRTDVVVAFLLLSFLVLL